MAGFWSNVGLLQAVGIKTLSEHYGQLLGLDATWRVVDLDLSLTELRVEIRLEAPDSRPVAVGPGSRVR